MKNRLLYLFIIFSGFNFQNNKLSIAKWVITNGGTLRVDGSTNINKFSCAISDYGKPDTILVSRGNTQPVQLNGKIMLDIQSFDCHNAIMTADLRKTLKSKEFPKLVIKFISLNKYPEGKQEITKGLVDIELAGVTRRFEINYNIAPSDNTTINLIGERKVNFSDFNIIPPKKLGGMIKTNNELNVIFNLKIKVID